MVTLPRLKPESLDFVLLSFEGPDEYAMAGGLGVRMKELSLELARQAPINALVDEYPHDAVATRRSLACSRKLMT